MGDLSPVRQDFRGGTGLAVAAPAVEVPAAFLPGAARAERRARGFGRRSRVAAGFVLVVVLPLLAVAWYLFDRAADQYHSDVAFSVRSEDGPSAAIGLLGAMTQLGASGSVDAEILYEFARSQAMVLAVDKRVDLRRIWAGSARDPVWALPPDATVEDLVRHWGRMVDVSLDGQAGLLSVRARAFSAADARAVTRAILAESAALVNRLSDQARQDAIRFAAADLAEAEAALRLLRADLADFRRTHRMIDPGADVSGRMGIVTSLETELADAMVARDTLLTYASEDDNRVRKANRRIEAVRSRIEAERTRLATGTGEDAGPEVVGRYEALLTDLEFAQTAYTQALANLAVARAESRRQARYLAAHIEPTLAQSALFPRRWTLLALWGLGLGIVWSVLMVLRYNVRDSL